jgi:hypothetical protein
MLSILSQLFVVENHTIKAGQTNLAIPFLGELDISSGKEVEPLLVTNMRRSFSRTKVAKAGYARYGFFECSVDEEVVLLNKFCSALIQEGVNENWSNTAKTILKAIETMKSKGVEPKIVVKPKGAELGFTDKSLRVLSVEGFENVLVSTQPWLAGYYIRSGDYVGVLAQQVDKLFCVVVA